MGSKKLRALFIDRDGVINKDPGGWTEHGYVTDWKDFHFLPGALEALRLLSRAGVKVVVISNQAGVGKGYFTKEKLERINGRMMDAIVKAGGRIEDVYYCIHRSEDACACRKPKTGLLERAARKHGIDCARTYIIGDSLVDVLAGKAMGCRTIFVRSGKTTVKEARQWSDKPDYVFANLLEAVRWLLAKEERKADRACHRNKRKAEVDEEDTGHLCDSGDRAQEGGDRGHEGA